MLKRSFPDLPFTKDILQQKDSTIKKIVMGFVIINLFLFIGLGDALAKDAAIFKASPRNQNVEVNKTFTIEILAKSNTPIGAFQITAEHSQDRIQLLEIINGSASSLAASHVKGAKATANAFNINGIGGDREFVHIMTVKGKALETRNNKRRTKAKIRFKVEQLADSLGNKMNARPGSFTSYIFIVN
jgi:hypothetical protein